MYSQIRVMVAESHPVMRAGIKHFLEKIPGITVICETGSSQEILPFVVEYLPDVLILDTALADEPDFAMITRCQSQYPPVRIILLSVHNDEASIARILMSGAHGCLLKDEVSLFIGEAVHRVVCSEESWFSSAVTTRLLSHKKVRTLAASTHCLTSSEIRILRLIGSGYDNQRIANELGLSLGTIKNYVSNIYAKIQVKTRAEAVTWGWQQGILTHQLTKS